MDTLYLTLEDYVDLHPPFPKEAADEPRIKENPAPTCKGLRSRLYGRDEKLAAVRKDNKLRCWSIKDEWTLNPYNRNDAKAEAQLYIDEYYASLADDDILMAEEEAKANAIYEYYGNALDNAREWAWSMLRDHVDFPYLLTRASCMAIAEEIEENKKAARLILLA